MTASDAEREVRSFCRICNAMCGIIVTVDGDTVVRVRGDDDHPLSRGYTCPKGRALGALHHDPRRLDRPSFGDDHRSPVDWESVIDDISDRISSSIAAHGPDSIAMYFASGSAFDTAGRRTSERFLTALGSKQKYTATTIDTPCKPLVAELVGGWSGLTPIWDHESSRLLLLFGSNPVVSHGHSNAIPDPISRLREFRNDGGEVWAIDPRRTETADLADRHLQIRPATDWLVLGWLVRRLLQSHPSSATIRQRSTGVDELERAVHDITDELVTIATGLSTIDLERLLGAVLRAGRVSALTGTGTSMSTHANITEYLLWALHIVTDSYDRSGGMWFNPGHLLQLDRREWSASDGVAEAGPGSRPSLPRRFGEYPCSALVPEIEAGTITTLIVVGGNPVTALPETARTIAALESLESLIVIDILPTETTAIATHVLPATDQLERADLTWLLDSFQLAVAAQHTDAVVDPVADRRPVWRMFAELADRLGIEVLPRGVTLADATEQKLLEPLIDRSRDPETLRESETLVIHSGAVHGWVTEKILPEGRWRLDAAPILEQLRDTIEATRSTEGPTGHLTLIAHRRLRTMNSQLRDVSAPGGRVETQSIHVSPQMAATIGTPGRAIISNVHGTVAAALVVDERLHPEAVTLAHGWGEQNVSGLTSTDQGVDPLTGMVQQSGLRCSLHASGDDGVPGSEVAFISLASDSGDDIDIG